MNREDCKVTVAETGEPIGTAKAAALAAFLAELAAKADPEKVRQYAEKKRGEKTA
jgi:hypothetical protein